MFVVSRPSLGCTDWDIFEGDLNYMVSVIMDYINFCINSTIPVKIIKTYPNSKCCSTPQIKESLEEKHKAFSLKG